MLPDEMFVPLIDMPRKETNEMGCLDVGYEERNWSVQLDNFIKKYKKMSGTIHVADLVRYDILFKLNAMLEILRSRLLIESMFK